MYGLFICDPFYLLSHFLKHFFGIKENEYFCSNNYIYTNIFCVVLPIIISSFLLLWSIVYLLGPLLLLLASHQFFALQFKDIIEDIVQYQAE